MLSKLRRAFMVFRLWVVAKTCNLMGFGNILNRANETIREQKKQIESLSEALNKYDRGTSLDVRSNLEVVDFEKLGNIVWVKVADQRLLRYETFNQIRDYMKGHGVDRPILLVTKNDVDLVSLSDEDLQRSGLKRMQPHERQ